MTLNKPVYFQWQLLDWDEVSSRSDIVSVEINPQVREVPPKGITPSLLKPQPRKPRIGVNKAEFRARKAADYAERDAKNRDLGYRGELMAIEFEKQRLIGEGRADLAESIRHISVVEGDGAGYDILSFDANGTRKYIEVKTTRGGVNTDFFISPNELAFADSVGAQFSIYRIFGYDLTTDRGEFYEVVGSPIEEFEAIPTGYRMRPK